MWPFSFFDIVCDVNGIFQILKGKILAMDFLIKLIQ